MTQTTCTSCGTELVEGSKFCVGCGAPNPQAQAAAPEAAPPAPPAPEPTPPAAAPVAPPVAAPPAPAPTPAPAPDPAPAPAPAAPPAAAPAAPPAMAPAAPPPGFPPGYGYPVPPRGPNPFYDPTKEQSEYWLVAIGLAAATGAALFAGTFGVAVLLIGLIIFLYIQSTTPANAEKSFSLPFTIAGATAIVFGIFGIFFNSIDSLVEYSGLTTLGVFTKAVVGGEYLHYQAAQNIAIVLSTLALIAGIGALVRNLVASNPRPPIAPYPPQPQQPQQPPQPGAPG